MNLTSEIKIVLLLFLLFIFPRIISRFHIPTSITVFILGLTLATGFDLSEEKQIIQVLSTIGISSLFLFAGLEVDLQELRSQRRILIQHVILRTLMVGGVSYAVHNIFLLDWRTSGLVSLAVLSPSAGFILDQLGSSNQTIKQKTWIRNLVIAAELVAMLFMFILLKVEHTTNLAVSSGILLILIFGLPWIFKGFIKYISPYTPNSEFSFLIIMSIVAALITKKIGTYYLIGAFVVGFTARIFQNTIPQFSSKQMMGTLKQFAGFFMPFYFFFAGSNISLHLFNFESVLLGLLLIVILGIFRLAIIVLHRKISLKENYNESIPIGISLLPNLVFGLVLTQILIKENIISQTLAGAMVVYCIGITLVPTFFWVLTGKNISTNEVD